MIMVPVPPVPPALTERVRREQTTVEPTVRIVDAPIYAKYKMYGHVDRASQDFLTPDVLAAFRREKADEDSSQEARQIFLNRIGDILGDASNFDDDCLKPSWRATRALRELIKEVSYSIILPGSEVYPDGEGGWRVEWRSQISDEDRYVLLAIHGTDERRDYIYVQQGDRRGDMLKDITANKLKIQLQWLQNQ